MITADKAKELSELSKTDMEQWSFIDKKKFKVVLKFIEREARMAGNKITTFKLPQNICAKLEEMGYDVEVSESQFMDKCIISWKEKEEE